jgi:PAS domain S-box-containing protein
VLRSPKSIRVSLPSIALFCSSQDTKGEILGHPVSIFDAPDDAAPAGVRNQLEVAKGRCEDERWQTRKDDCRFWAGSALSLPPCPTRQGNYAGFAKGMRDMSEHNVVNETIERSRRSMQNIIDVSPGVMYIFDIQERKNVFSNRSAAAALGYAPWQVEAAAFVSSVMHPDDWNPFLDHLGRLANLRDEETADFEYRMRHNNGAWRWFHSRDKVFTRNADGSVRDIIGAATDITERKITEEKNRFIVDLNEALLPLVEPEQMIAVAMRLLGEHLGVDRSAYADVEADEDHFVVVGEYTRDAASMVGRYRVSDFSERERQVLREGGLYVVNDIDVESQEGTDFSLYRRAGIQSMVAVPLKKDRKFVARIAVHQNTRRRWLSEEIDLITTVANRCWESIERARALKRLKDSDDRYRAFLANSSEGIWRYELDEPIPVTLPVDDQIGLFYKRGYIAECNEVFARTHGYSGVDQILGWRVRDLLVQLDPDRVNEYARAFIRGGYRLIGAEAGEVDIHGNTKYFLSNLIGIVENGTLIRVWGTQRDITQQKRAEAALRESEERFAKAFHASPDALIISRIADGVILEVNDSFVSLFGYDRAELIGKSTLQLCLYVDPDERRRALKVLQEDGRVREIEFKMKRKSGELLLIQFSAEPLDLHGEHCLLAIGRDIAEHRRAEKEREDLLQKEKTAREDAESANRLKDEFLATISHELRTPLTAILGWARMLREGALTEPQMRHAFEVIQRSGESQAQLVDDILDTARIFTGRFNLEVRPIQVNRILQAAADVIRPSAEGKGITLQVATDNQSNIVLGDARRVQQIFWNLLSNSVKFTNKGGRIEARLARIGDRIEVSISDTGIGIDPHFLPHVFDRFRQADSSSTRKYSGLGLGLAIVRHLAEVHGGSVSASSLGIGLGSTFKVDFPAAPRPCLPQPESGTQVDSSHPDVCQELKGVCVLVVEDDPETLDLLKFILDQRQAEVTTATSAAEALRVLEDTPADVLISDLAMPDQDGYDLIRRVRSLAPERGGNVPAVALSAYTRAEDRMRSLAAGFSLHLPKPVDPAELVAALARLAGLKN